MSVLFLNIYHVSLLSTEKLKFDAQHCNFKEANILKT